MLPGAVKPYYTPASVDDAIQQAAVAPIFCLIVTSGRREPIWTAGTGLAWTVAQTDEVNDVQVNGISLVLGSDHTDVEGNAGKWFWDGSTIFISTSDSTDPNLPANVVETFLTYRFSDGPTDAGGFWWEPRLINLPGMSLSIPVDFKGLLQIGGGNVVLANEDRFFQSRYTQNWDAGTTQLVMGIAGLDYSLFKTLATFANFKATLNDKQFNLQVRENNIKIDVPFPTNLYNQVIVDGVAVPTTAYPNIRASDIGRAVQIAYGQVFSIDPVCLDVGVNLFQVAGHAIKSFDGVRVKDTNGVWQPKGFFTTNLALGQFTMALADWKDGQDIAVDFTGKLTAGGILMDNPADVVQDLLIQMGESALDADFLDAHNWFDIGYFKNPATRASISSPGLYLDSQQSGLDVVNQVAINCRSYVQQKPAGGYKMRPFRTYQGQNLATITDIDLLEPGMVRDQPTTTKLNKISSCTVTYAPRNQEQFNQVYTYTRPSNQFTRNQGQDVNLVFDSIFYKESDAQYLAQAMVSEWTFDLVTYSIKMKWRAFTWVVGDHVNIMSTLAGLNVMAEIVAIKINLTARQVDLTLGNLRGNNEGTGFWVGNSDTCPDGNSLNWAQDADKEFRIHNSGHWHNANDQATNSPVDASDWNVSRWF